jgi:hypothetical protein
MELGIRNVPCERSRLRFLELRVEQKLSYAEALEKVEEDGRSGERSRDILVQKGE